MKFDITRQQVFTSLVTLFVMSLLGLCSIATGNHTSLSVVMGESLFAKPIFEFQSNHNGWAAVITSVLIFISATNLGRIISTQNLLGRSASIHIPILGVIFWCVALNSNLLIAVLSTTLAAQTLGGFILSVNSKGYLGHLFNATLSLSVLPMLYTPSVVMWIAMPIALIFMGVTLREWIAAIAGLLLPLAGVSYIYWLCGYEFLSVVNTMFDMLMSHTHIIDFETIPIFHTAIIALALPLALISLCWFGDNVYKSKARLLITAIALFASLLSILAPSSTVITLAMLAPPMALLASYSIVHMQGRAANILYITLMVLLMLSMLTPLHLPLETLTSLLGQ